MRKLSSIVSTRYIISEIRNEKIVRCIVLCYTILSGIICAVLHIDYTQEKALWMVALLVPVPLGLLIYFLGFFPCYRTICWLKRNSLDIFDVLTSGNAVISDSPFAVIPFSQIAWIYLNHPSGEEEPPYSYFLEVRCTDGSAFTIYSNAESWYYKILSAVPNVIIGMPGTALSLYLTRFPRVKAKRYRKHGSLLLLAGIGFATMSIVNQHITWASILILAFLLLTGGWLLIKSFHAKNSL